MVAATIRSPPCCFVRSSRRVVAAQSDRSLARLGIILPHSIRDACPVAPGLRSLRATRWSPAMPPNSPRSIARAAPSSGCRPTSNAVAITDFEALAKSLLSHPLERFRNEAMHSLLTAWGRKDPGRALAFIDGYNLPAYQMIRTTGIWT